MDPVDKIEDGEVVETSLREDMEAAISEVEEADETIEVANVEETPEVKVEKAESLENGDTPPAEKTAKISTEGEPGADGTPPAVEVKAPQSWSPKLREDFAKLPANIQAQINKREAEMSTFQNDGAESRKFGDRISQTLQPYQAVMTAQGFNDPVEAVKGLMDTAAMLQMGTEDQKAQRLAELVQHYGIDIQKLDNALVGNPQSTPEQTQLEQMLERKLAPMQDFMSSVQTNQQQSQQQVQTNAQNDIAQFEQKAEFISDVRMDMADLMDMARNRNEPMTLQQAYDKACAINPEISAVIKQRADDDLIKGNALTTRNKRYAASSIKGNQVGVGGAPEADTIEGALNQAWDDQMGS